MKKLAILLLFPSLAFAQVQVQGKPGGAIQIGGNQPGVSSIQGATGDFTFTGDGFSGCTTSGGVTTCTFPGSSGITSVNGQTGPAITLQSAGGTIAISNPSANVINLEGYGGGNAGQCFLGIGGLVGAYTDSSGIFKQALCIGNGPVSFTVPAGATQLQLGINDDNFNLNLGSFSVSVSINGATPSTVTVGGTVMPWSPTLNPSYTFGMNNGTSPVVAATGLSAGDTVTITRTSGTVQVGNDPPYPPSDGNGFLSVPPGPAGVGGPTGSAMGSGVWPTYYMSASAYVGGSVVTSIDSQTGAFTFTGSGVSHVGNAYTFSGGSGTPGGSTGQLQYNNAGAFGGDTGSTTDGAGNVTTKTLSTTGTAGAGGLLKAVEGAAPSAAAGYDILYADSASHCFKQSLNGGSFACLGTGSGSLNVNGSPVSSPNLQDSATVTFGVSGSNITATAAGGSGGYTNIAGSGSQTTVAAINTLCGTGTLYATTPLSIATGGTVSCPVQFSKSGLWTVASGQTVTFSRQVKQTDAPSQIFAGSGVVVLPAQEARAEWWGYVADGNLGANTGTDNYPAVQAAITALPQGTLSFPCGFARFTSGTPTISGKSNFKLQGCVIGGNNTNQTTWFASTSTLGNVKFAGSSGAHDKWNAIDAITFARAVAGSTTAGQGTGIDIEWNEGFSLTNYRVEDSGPYGIYLLLPDAAFSGHTSYGAVEWGFNGISPSAGTYYCYYLDASQPTESWVTDHRGCLTNNKVDGTHIFYGDYMSGGTFEDQMHTWFQTFLITTPVYMNWSGVGGFKTGDIHYTHSIFDSSFGSCMNINAASDTTSNITFDEGWCNTGGATPNATYGFEAHSSRGVHINNFQFEQSGSTAAMNFDTCTACSAENNHIVMSSGMTKGILVNASSSGHYSNNDIQGVGSAQTLMQFTGSSNNTVASNTLSGTASIGLAFDGTSNNNLSSTLNKIVPTSITTPVSDSGSGNALALSNATNLNGGALGSLPYQSAANTTAFVASPTTTGHTFVPAWQPSGSVIAPAALDLGTYLASPPAIGGTTPAAGSFSSLKDTGAAAGTGSACLQIDTAGTISNTGTACGTGGGSGTNVQVNGGSTLTTSNQTGVLPYNCSDSSGSGTAQSCTTSTSFTLSSGNCLVYKTTTANSGSGLTLAINGGSALTVRVASATGWTSTLQSSPASIPANQPMLACYDGTNVNMSSTGNSSPLGSNGLFVFTPPVPGNFTWTNQGSCTTSTSDPNTLFVSCPNNGGADNIRSLLENVPGSTPYTKTMWFSSDLPSFNYLSKGMAMTDGTKYLTFAYESNGNDCTGNGWAVAVTYWTAANTFSSTPAKTCIQTLPWIGLKITVSGGTDTYSYSKDGVHWIQLFSETDHTHLTQTKIGMFENPNNSTYGLDMTVASWTDQ